MKTYNWQQADWPNFSYNLTPIQEMLFSIAEKTGYIQGKLIHLSDQQKTEAMVSLMVEEAVKTSEIEGEYISRPDVRSSIKNKLGLNPQIQHVHDKRATGIAELMLDVRNTFKQKLTQTKLFDWHAMLLAIELNPSLTIGRWRSHPEPMQIISGRPGKYIIHFEAPPSKIIPAEMKKFINWFNDTAPGKAKAIKFAPVRAAIAHLYFESIHPFEDGNGRIGRAIAEKALSQGFGYPAILSLSAAIESDKKAYYAALNAASKSIEITAWLEYFVNVILSAQIAVEAQINFIIKKSTFFDKFKNHLNDRQLKIIQRMLQAGPDGFEGGMSAKKYMAITRTSKATATRDLQNLVELGVLKPIGSGRSAHYEILL